jgi:protein TonB
VSSRNPSPGARARIDARPAALPAQDGLRRPLAWSAAFHAALIGALIVSAFFTHRGELWGGTGAGAAITVGLVGSVPGVPLPKPSVVTASRVVDVTKGLYQSEPRPQQPEEKATPLPEFKQEKRPRYVTPRPSRVLENPAPPPPNAIPYGQGGTPTLPYTAFTMTGQTQGGLSFSGPGGEFGGRFPWYVAAVQRRVSSNWLWSTIEPTIRWAPRVVVDFVILRDGTITNIQLTRSSGDASVDASAIRAVRASSPLDPLPSGYSGSYVSVEFWFDFHR